LLNVSLRTLLWAFQADIRIAYGWKLGLVAISVLPVLLFTGYFEMRLQDHLQDTLRDAYGASAQLACEQIASIRTVASLRRENALYEEFLQSMEAPVRKAMISTATSTVVYAFSQGAPLFINVSNPFACVV
jgi:ATP-binding cassette, subfamily B (MDR/TAP), member 1